jgi:hypothetical protein
MHPDIKLFSLPRLGLNKSIELGVKGNTASVAAAMAEIKAGVSAAGFPWSTLPIVKDLDTGN